MNALQAQRQGSNGMRSRHLCSDSTLLLTPPFPWSFSRKRSHGKQSKDDTDASVFLLVQPPNQQIAAPSLFLLLCLPLAMTSPAHHECVCVCVRACPLESGQSCHLNQGLFLNLGMRLSMRWTEDDTQQSSIAPPSPTTRKFSDAEYHLH